MQRLMRLKRLIPCIALALTLIVCAKAEDMAKPVVTELMKQSFPVEAGNEGRMILVEFAPGAGSPPHSHPGAIYAYVLEGSIESGVNADESKVFKVGEFWYEPPGCVHRVAKNASTTEKAKLLVFFVTKPGLPVAGPPTQPGK